MCIKIYKYVAYIYQEDRNVKRNCICTCANVIIKMICKIDPVQHTPTFQELEPAMMLRFRLHPLYTACI